MRYAFEYALRTFGWTLGFLVLQSNASADKIVTFEILGEDWGNFDRFYDISADGSVIVGNLAVSADNRSGFRWEAGSLTEIPELTEAFAVSDDGSVIAGSFKRMDIDKYEAIRFTNGVVTRLGDLPGGTLESSSTAISGDGTVIVGLSSSAIGAEAFRWKDGTMTGLGPEPDGAWPYAYASSRDGSIVIVNGYQWSDGTWTKLEPLPEDTYITGYGISADGSIIVGHSVEENPSNSTPRACLWRNGTVLPLDGPLPSFRPFSQAFGVSADGTTVVGVSYTGDTEETQTREPVLWYEDSGYKIVSLRSILEGHGIDLSGITFSSTSDPLVGGGPLLSSDGTTIVGTALYRGKDVIFRVRIVDSTPVDPLIGGTPIEGLPGWYRSDWFGAYNTTLAPWIFHAQHGFVYHDPSSTNQSMFIYDDAMHAWWWTNETVYPFIYAFDPPADNAGTDIESEWLWYFEGSSNPRLFGVVTGDEAGSVLFFEP